MTTTDLLQLKDRSLTQRAEDHLTEYILSGKLAPGDALPPEQELSRQLGIGRSTLRETISILQAKGLVERQHGVGLRVVDRSQQAASEMLVLMLRRTGTAARDLLEVRRLYEVQAAAWAAERATDEDREALRQSLRAMQPVGATLEQCVAADVAFHEAIARASHNVVLEWMVAAIHSLLSGAIRLTMQEGFQAERVYRRHAPILEAIERRDAAGAAQAMADHLRFTEERLRQAGETAL